MEINRISVKLPVADGSNIEPALLIPLFHRWIQDKAVEGLLLDVADYSHVPDGPGVMLVGHEGDYAIDYMSGKPQLMYQRKRAMTGDLRDRLRLTLRLALQAAKALQANPAPHGPIALRSDELTVALIDRLHAPNNSATWATFREDLEAVAGELYDGGGKAEWVGGDPRGNFDVRITANKPGSVASFVSLEGAVG